jgi:hypothetical protein
MASTKFQSARDLAKAADVSHTAVNRWVKHPEWPFSRKPPWKRSDLPAILRWAADILRPAAADDGSSDEMKALRKEKLRQEIRKLMANANQAETSLAKERGYLHDADACEEEAVRRASLYRNAVQNLPAQVVSIALSNGMPHEAAPAFQKNVEQLVSACLKFTAASMSESPTDDDEGGDSSSAA